MAVIVHDTLSLFESLFTAELRPKALFELGSQKLFYDDNSLTVQIDGMMRHKVSGGYAVMEAAQTDGFVTLNHQQAWGTFNPSRKRHVSAYQFEQHRKLDTLNWLAERVTYYAACLELDHDVQVFLMPADNANRNVMIDSLGVSGFAGVRGYLGVRLWPTVANLLRLDKLLARLLFLQSRVAKSHLNRLRDWLTLEGDAARFVAQQFPDELFPWAVTWQKSADYDAALAKIATLRGIDVYDHMLTNIFGAVVPIGSKRPPQIEPMDAETFAYAEEVIREALDETDPIQIAAHLYGDELVARQGYPTAGLPAYAGYEVAYRWVL
ncbi:MAG: DUF2268 domain-containing putative Zn-dependent protease [Candidatus Promineifilaceae bacterium]